MKLTDEAYHYLCSPIIAADCWTVIVPSAAKGTRGMASTCLVKALAVPAAMGTR